MFRASLNRERHAGYSDWAVIFTVQCKDSGVVETEMHALLKQFKASGTYVKDGKVIHYREIFKCESKKIVAILKRKFSDYFVTA